MIRIELLLTDLEVEELRGRFKAIGKQALSESEVANLIYDSRAVKSYIREIRRQIKEQENSDT